MESESNKADAKDEYNRADILVENEAGELIIIKVQNAKEYDYFHQILYGTSKAVVEHIQSGDAYDKTKKVISIVIAYFDLGKGEEYLYHVKTEFKNPKTDKILKLSDYQRPIYGSGAVYKIFPEYWIIKVGYFGSAMESKLDEWIYFFKTGEVQMDFTARGLSEAKAEVGLNGIRGLGSCGLQFIFAGSS